MATVQELRRRVRSITNTRKITKAMELVASARLRRAQERIRAELERFKEGFVVHEDTGVVGAAA